MSKSRNRRNSISKSKLAVRRADGNQEVGLSCSKLSTGVQTSSVRVLTESRLGSPEGWVNRVRPYRLRKRPTLVKSVGITKKGGVTRRI